MGYTTEFSGKFTITPGLPTHIIEEANAFCATRHDGNIYPHDYAPSIWCDWEFEEDGTDTIMRWNGNEKSYAMYEWLGVLIEKFVNDGVDRDISGRIIAQGEDMHDRWEMVADSKTRTISKKGLR